MIHAYGNINADGSIVSGSSGISTVVHDDKGEYTVIFSEGLFSKTPTIAAIQNHPGWSDFNSDGGSTKDNTTLIAVSKTKAKMKTGDGNGTATDRNFCIIAIGV